MTIGNPRIRPPALASSVAAPATRDERPYLQQAGAIDAVISVDAESSDPAEIRVRSESQRRTCVPTPAGTPATDRTGS